MCTVPRDGSKNQRLMTWIQTLERNQLLEIVFWSIQAAWHIPPRPTNVIYFFFFFKKQREEFYNRQCGWKFGMKSEFLFEYVTKNGRSVKMFLAISEPSSNLASPDFAGRQPVCLWSVGAQSQSESTQPLLNHAKPPTWIGILPAGTGLLTSHFSFLLSFL